MDDERSLLLLPDDLHTPLLRMLAYAAVTPKLRNLLVMNATFPQLARIDAVLGQLLAAAGEYGEEAPPEPHTLSSLDNDDTLWGATAVPKGQQGLVLAWQPGLLAVDADAPLRRVIIPDLAQANLAVLRAATVAAGAEVVHIERHGRGFAGPSRVVWLAGCAAADRPKISPHLLDRFSLRLTVVSEDSGTRLRTPAQLQQLLDSGGAAEPQRTVAIAPELAQQLAAAMRASPKPAPGTLDAVALYPSLESATRRQVVLMRAAEAEARLSGAAAVTADHVAYAAELLGFVDVEVEQDDEDVVPPVPAPLLPEDTQDEYDEVPNPALSPNLRQQPTEPAPAVPPHAADTIHEFLPEILSQSPEELFAEDMARAERFHDSLRIVPSRSSSHRRLRGPSIGAEPTEDAQDLALVAILFEAAKYQPVRRLSRAFGAASQQEDALIILPSDLRRHRRAPVPDHALLLLVDYTSLRVPDWPQRLMPLLQTAYAERASIHLIRVGAADAAHELLADQTSFGSILVPGFAALLFETEAGRATPMAHGLLLVRELLRKLYGGRTSLERARLVILSDGRGNIPLAASLKRQITEAAGRAGVDDALDLCREIAGIKQVERFVVDLDPPYRREFQQQFADALRATVYRYAQEVQNR